MSEPIYAWTASGRHLHVDLDDARAHALVAADGDLNPLSLTLWQRALAAHPWDVVVDVGVNYGEMLVGVDLPAGARVVGFEPNPVVRACAERTLRDHRLDVDLRADAVGAAPGTARFAVDPDWSGLSSFATAATGEAAGDAPGTRKVSVTTLDAVLAAGGATGPASFCVKVDVEGFEADVLAGARASLARAVPWVVMLECLHLPPGMLAGLAAEHVVLLMPREPGAALVRVGADDADRLLADARVYPQDCLLVSPEALSSLA